MKQFQKLILAVCFLLVATMQSQTFEFSVSYIGINGSTSNHQFAFIATPSSTITSGVTADIGAGFYVPLGLTIGNFVIGNSGLPASEWSVQTLGASNVNGDPYFISRVEAGSSSIELNGDGPFQLVLFDIIADPNPTSGNISFVENGDPVFNEILFIQNYINVNFGSGTFDGYNQNNPLANSVDFSTLSTTDFETYSNEISIYPNPASNYIKVSGYNISECSYVIYDIQGKELVAFNFKNGNSIDISQFNTGVYFISIIDDFTTITKKIIKL